MTFRNGLLATTFLMLSTLLYAADWQVIRHPHFNLIFDDSIEQEARRTASRLVVYLEQHLDELPIERGLAPTDIVLMNEAHVANGSVSIFPYRSIWYNRPAPFAQLEWLDVLAVHEGRHIVQLNQSRDSDWARVVSFLFGDAGTGAMLLLMPDWYLEGDATVSETTLTEGGRGRVASFDLWYRTDLLTQEPYDYERAMLGTGFDRLPYVGPYVLGYFFTGYLRQTYGDDIFEAALDDIGQWSGWTFNAAIRERTGKNLDELYDDMLTTLTEQWRSDMIPASESRSTDTRWNSHYPVWAEGNREAILTLGLTQSPTLIFSNDSQPTATVAIPTQVARHYRSGSKTRAISVLDDRACWVLERPHPSHPFKSYGDIECADTNGERQRLTRNDKLTSVVQTPEFFIAHRFDEQRQSSLVWFNTDGTEQNKRALPVHSLAYDLSVQGDDLVYVLSGTDNDGIYRLDLTSNQAPVLMIPAQQESLRAPTLTERWLLFTSDRSGRDQLMALNLATGTQFQSSNRPFGAYYPIWNATHQQLIFADYQAGGMVRRQQPFTDSNSALPEWTPVSSQASRTVWVESLIPNGPAPNEPAKASWTVEDYSIMKNLWNPYSWAVLGDTTGITGTVSSLDTLSKLALSANAGYDFDAMDWSAGVSGQYRLDAGPRITAGWQRASKQTDLSASLSQPFAFQSSLGQTQLMVQAGTLQRFQPGEDETYLTGGASAAYRHQRAMQAIETPFGLSEAISTRYSLTNNRFSAVSETSLALAGWHTRHALNARLGTQWLNDDTPLLADSPLFATPDAQGLTLQSDVDYRINLGPVGAGLGSLVYWRNTEMSLNGRAQITEDTTDTAVGLSLSPNLALFRNALLTATPQLSVYYLPKDEQVQITVSARIANF